MGYFRQILKQESAWFDTNQYQELPSRMNQEVLSIQKAIGEKMGTVLFCISLCVSGLTFGFTRGWALAFLVLLVSPFLVIGTDISTKALQDGFA